MGCCTKTNEKRVFGFLQLNNYFSMINFISFDIKISLIIGNKRKQDENLICKVIDKNRQAEAEVIFQSVWVIFFELLKSGRERERDCRKIDLNAYIYFFE